MSVPIAIDARTVLVGHSEHLRRTNMQPRQGHMKLWDTRGQIEVIVPTVAGLILLSIHERDQIISTKALSHYVPEAILTRALEALAFGTPQRR